MLLVENVSGLRRKLRKKLEHGTRRTRVLMLNLWFVRKVGEENAGTHEISMSVRQNRFGALKQFWNSQDLNFFLRGFLGFLGQ